MQQMNALKDNWNDKTLAAALRELEEYRELGIVDSFRK